MSEQQEYEWNGLLVRRDERGKWETCPNGGWYSLHPAHAVEKAVIAELDKLYPVPRTVTLDNGEVWHKIGPARTTEEEVDEWQDQDGQSYYQYEGGVLDTLYRLQNGDDR